MLGDAATVDLAFETDLVGEVKIDNVSTNIVSKMYFTQYNVLCLLNINFNH